MTGLRKYDPEILNSKEQDLDNEYNWYARCKRHHQMVGVKTRAEVVSSKTYNFCEECAKEAEEENYLK
jgi:hypothetical protein